MFNCYYLEYHGYRKGTPGQSWRTGTNGWLLQSTVKYIFGLVPELEGLKLNPCIPNSWKECSITKLFRGCTYNIKYIQKGNEHNNRISNIFVNGQEKQFKDNIIPSIEGAALDITVYLDK